MPPTSDLDPLGQFFEHQFDAAWALFRAEKFEKANALSRWLLLQPRIANLHAAGLQLLLAHSPDPYVHDPRFLF